VTESRRKWPNRTLAVLLPLVGIDLVIQYIAGLGTNAYAPPAGFNMNTDFGIYNVHWLNGYVLGILSIVLVIVAAFSRQTRVVVPAVVSLAAVLIAAFAGMAFVNSTPNPPSATITMGLAFLVAFSAVMAMMFRGRMQSTLSGPPPSQSASSV
jgi:heme A synthase